MKMRKKSVMLGLLVVCAGLLVLSSCVTVLDRRPVVQGREKEREREREKRVPPGYRVGTTVVVTGVVLARGNAFILNDDASDFVFQFEGVRFDEKAALQRATNKHVTIQLAIKGQQGGRVMVADFIRVMR